MPISRLEAARFKLVRAREHLDYLDREITDYYQRRPYTQRADPNPPPGEFLIYAVLNEPPNPYWGTVLGDAIHNMRSALNYVACGLVAANGGTITASTQFPIHREKATFDSRGVKEELNGASGIAKDVVRTLQPYQVPNPEDHPLQILGTLSNADKHRYLPVATFGTQSVQAQLQAVNPAVAEILHANTDEIEHDALLLHGRMTTAGPSERAFVNFRFTTLLLIDGRVRTGRLKEIQGYIQTEVVPRLQGHIV